VGRLDTKNAPEATFTKEHDFRSLDTVAVHVEASMITVPVP